MLLVLQECMVHFEMIHNCHNLCNDVSIGTTFYASIVISVEPFDFEQHNLERKIIKLENFFKLAIIHSSARTRS